MTLVMYAESIKNYGLYDNGELFFYYDGALGAGKIFVSNIALEDCIADGWIVVGEL